MKAQIFLVVWLLFCGALQAQSTNTLSGTVSDPSGLPIIRASVLLQGATHDMQKRAQTGAAGEFIIPAVAAGSRGVELRRLPGLYGSESGRPQALLL